jgi:hypothetical protein
MLAHSNESKQVNIKHGGNNNPNVALNRNISIILEQGSSSSVTTIDNVAVNICSGQRVNAQGSESKV